MRLNTPAENIKLTLDSNEVSQSVWLTPLQQRKAIMKQDGESKVKGLNAETQEECTLNLE